MKRLNEFDKNSLMEELLKYVIRYFSYTHSTLKTNLKLKPII